MTNVYQLARQPRRLDALAPYDRHRSSNDVLVSYRDTIEPINSRILTTYLPSLTRYGMIHHGELNLDRLLEAQQFHGTSRRWFRSAMLDTLDTLITSLSRNIDRSETTSLELSTFLEDSLHENYIGRIADHRHGLVYQRFYCLSQIASFAKSERIQSVLTQFVTKYGGKIVQNETEMAVFDWCWLIVQNFKDADRVGALREIILKRPQILEDIRDVHHRNPSWQTQRVYEVVQDMLDRLYENEDAVLSRGRSLQRRGPPVQRYYSLSPPHRRGEQSRMEVYDRSYSGPMVPRALDHLSRRALSQRGDNNRLRRIEAKIDVLGDVVVHVSDNQRRQEMASRRAREIWSDSDDSRF